MALARQRIWFEFEEPGTEPRANDPNRYQSRKGAVELKVARVGWVDWAWDEGFSIRLHHLEDRGSRRRTSNGQGSSKDVRIGSLECEARTGWRGHNWVGYWYGSSWQSLKEVRLKRRHSLSLVRGRKAWGKQPQGVVQDPLPLIIYVLFFFFFYCFIYRKFFFWKKKFLHYLSGLVNLEHGWCLIVCSSR